MGDLKRSVVAVWIWCLVAKTPRPGLSGELISFSLRCQLVVKLSVLAVLDSHEGLGNSPQVLQVIASSPSSETVSMNPLPNGHLQVSESAWLPRRQDTQVVRYVSMLTLSRDLFLAAQSGGLDWGEPDLECALTSSPTPKSPSTSSALRCPCLPEPGGLQCTSSQYQSPHP